MANDTKVTLSKVGTAKEVWPVSKIDIPELRNIAMAIRRNDSIMYREETSDKILEVWNLAHDFKRHITEERP